MKTEKTKTENDVDNLWTRKEVAARLATCSHTIARWEKRGLIQGVRLGKRVVRYRPRDVAKLIADALV